MAFKVGETVVYPHHGAAEIVSKAVACGLPMLASRSAATGLAVDLARRFGVNR